MRLARLYVILALVVFAYCEEQATDDVATTTSPSVHEDEQIENVKEEEKIVETEEDNDTLKIQDPLDPKNSQLPILPPLILLDFGNDDDNSTSGDEKSKRTIDGNLGYGFARNGLFSGKSNYYFPAGKSGTTVSIEESISPFGPKTIYENVKPISENPSAAEQNNAYGQNPLQQKNLQASSGQQPATRQTAQGQNNQAQSVPFPQPVFGQRTKLYKPSQIDYSAYQGFGSTPQSTIESYTTARPDYRANGFPGGQNAFATAQPGFPSGAFTTGFPQGSYTTQRPFGSYSTTAPPSYVTPTPSYQSQRYTANSANSFGTSRPSFDGITTPRPQNFGSQAYAPDAPLASFSNLPRYTIENGVRYENKIIWKYPDGKISQTPPSSYINAYNEFLSKQNPGAVPQGPSYQNVGSGAGFPNPGSSGSFQNLGAGVNYQNLAGQPSFQNPNYQNQFVRYQNPQDQTRFPAASLGNIYSKSPAQFPKDQEPNKPRQSPFVSSASLQAGSFGTGSRAPQASPAPQGQSYELGYQGQFGLRTSQLLGNSAGSPGFSSAYQSLQKDNTKLSKGSYRTSYEKERLVPKYEVNSPNPEYTYTTESSLKSSTSSSDLLTPSGTLAPKILSKYSTQAQKYLKNVFTPEKSAIRKYQAALASSAGQSYTTPSPSFAGQSYTTAAPSFGRQSYTTSAPSFGGQSYTTAAPSFGGQSYTTSAPSFGGQSYTTSAPNFAGQSYTTSAPSFAGQSYTSAAPNFGGQSYTTSAPNFGGQSYTTAAPNFAGQSYTTPAPNFGGQNYQNPSAPYINTDYEHLLNYNPSISQYIRNPQSILKAQPTYIQAGNSLIPVIILRVDGAPPVHQPKVTPNINLKALLQQYLTQYAGSIGQNGNDYGGASGKHGDSQQNSLEELNRLAQTLSQYSRESQANKFEGSRSPYETVNSNPTKIGYDSRDKNGGGLSNYGTRTKTQKIKSVQIIEDPRYTSYKVDS